MRTVIRKPTKKTNDTYAKVIAVTFDLSPDAHHLFRYFLDFDPGSNIPNSKVMAALDLPRTRYFRLLRELRDKGIFNYERKPKHAKEEP